MVIHLASKCEEEGRGITRPEATRNEDWSKHK